MAAQVLIREWNGVAPGTATDKTSSTVRLKAADDATVDLNDPIVRPPSGTAYSYEKVLRLYIGSPGPTGSITNPRAYTDGSSGLGTGITVNAGATGSYVQPVVTASAVAVTDIFSYTSGSPLDMDTNNPGPFTGTNTDIADFLYMQAAVISTASPGLTGAETLTFAYDET